MISRSGVVLLSHCAEKKVGGSSGLFRRTRPKSTYQSSSVCFFETPCLSVTVEVFKKYAVAVLQLHVVTRQIPVRWAVYIEEFMLFVIHYDANSMNFYLVIGAYSKLLCWECIFYKEGNFSLCSAFSVMLEHLTAFHGEALVFFQVGFLKAGHINIFLMEFF